MRPVTLRAWSPSTASWMTVTGFPTGVPGLIVNAVDNGRGWGITHEHSGCAILWSLPSPEAALYAARCLADVTDWTADADTVKPLAKDAVLRLADEMGGTFGAARYGYSGIPAERVS